MSLARTSTAPSGSPPSPRACCTMLIFPGPQTRQCAVCTPCKITRTPSHAPLPLTYLAYPLAILQVLPATLHLLPAVCPPPSIPRPPAPSPAPQSASAPADSPRPHLARHRHEQLSGFSSHAPPRSLPGMPLPHPLSVPRPRSAPAAGPSPTWHATAVRSLFGFSSPAGVRARGLTRSHRSSASASFTSACSARLLYFSLAVRSVVMSRAWG